MVPWWYTIGALREGPGITKSKGLGHENCGETACAKALWQEETAHINEFNRVPGARARKGKRNMVHHGSGEPGRNQRRQELVGHIEGLYSTKLLASMIV